MKSILQTNQEDLIFSPKKLLFIGFSFVAIVSLLSLTVSCDEDDNNGQRDLQWKETFLFPVAEQAQNSKILHLAYQV